MITNLPPVLIYGYGNVDREDDGVAWHILQALSARLGRPTPATPDDEFPENIPGDYPHFEFALQLTPEIAEDMAKYAYICFVDAHTGSVPHNVNLAVVEPHFQRSPLTHHLTAASCLEMSKTLYGKCPQTILVSVRGYLFGFERELSSGTQALMDEAVDAIWQWLQQIQSSPA